MDAMQLTSQIFLTREDAIKKYHHDRVVLQFTRPLELDLKIQNPCATMELDMIEEKINVPIDPYYEVLFVLREFTDGKGRYWWRYVKS